MATQQIDTFEIAYIPMPQQSRTTTYNPSGDITTLINSINATLVSVGWTSTGITATGVLPMVEFDSQQLYTDDARHDPAPVLIINLSQIINPWGVYGHLEVIPWTLAQFAGEISGAYEGGAEPDYDYGPGFGTGQAILITATGSGPDYNAPNVWMLETIAAGFTGTPSLAFAGGGGYSLVSQPANGNTTYQVNITQDAPLGINQIHFHFILPSGGTADHYLYAAADINPATYTMIANGYQFLILDPTTPAMAEGLSSTNYLFASAPCVDQDKTPGLTSCLVTTDGLNSYYAVNNSLSPGQYSIAQRYFNGPWDLDTVGNVPLTQNAYVVLPDSMSIPRIVGKFWDACVLPTAVNPVGSSQGMLDHTFTEMSVQEGTYTTTGLGNDVAQVHTSSVWIAGDN